MTQTTNETRDTHHPLDYNKVWMLLLTLGILVLLDYLGVELHVLLEGAALIFAVERTPNGRVPLRSQNR